MGLTREKGCFSSVCKTQRYTISFEMQLKPLIVGVNLKFSSICMVVLLPKSKSILCTKENYCSGFGF